MSIETIEFSEMLYCRVEPQYSLQHMPGFQTVYKSDDLLEKEIDQIEERIRSFQTDNKRNVRYQFFKIDTGRFILTHSVVIDSDPVIVDKCQREGMFLSHCLVITPQEFLKIKNNPFQIFNNFTFIKSADDLVEKYIKSGVTKPSKISLNLSTIPIIGEYFWKEALVINSLAEQIFKPQLNSSTLAILGNSDEILNLISALFFYTLPTMRLKYNFDSFVDPNGKNWGDLKIVGISDTSVSLPFSISKRSLKEFTSASIKDRKTYYSTWLKKVTNTGSYEFIDQLHNIQEICEFINNDSAILPTQIDDRLTRSLSDSCQGMIKGSLFENLSRIFSRELAASISQFASTEMDVNTLHLLKTNQSIDIIPLSKVILGWLKSISPLINKTSVGDNKKFEYIATQSRNFQLLFISSYLSKNEKLRQFSIDQMTFIDFDKILFFLNNPMPLKAFVTKNKLNYLVQNIQPNLDNFSDDQIFDFIKSIIQYQELSLLDQFSERVMKISETNLKPFLGLLKQKSLPDQFRIKLLVRKHSIHTN
ncbi:hypothetical protein SDC9_43873 [bioreactor metagenome]|uniref:Uncharacterized protein n=1 Tax=bioreactor metagenome TaxID=1076179 RepID=A0A644W1Y0_9ZZZZ